MPWTNNRLTYPSHYEQNIVDGRVNSYKEGFQPEMTNFADKEYKTTWSCIEEITENE